jgi:hypothetical protein
MQCASYTAKAGLLSEIITTQVPTYLCPLCCYRPKFRGPDRSPCGIYNGSWGSVFLLEMTFLMLYLDRVKDLSPDIIYLEMESVRPAVGLSPIGRHTILLC